MTPDAVDEAIQKFFLFQFKDQGLPWHPRHGSRDDLAKLFGQLGFMLGAEIGTQRGLFAKLLCWRNPKLHLVCIDPWESYTNAGKRRQSQIYSEAVTNLRGKNARIIRKRSLDAIHDIGSDCLDFVFIDGDHSFDSVMQDIIAWSSKVRAGGIVAVHDYCPVGGVMQAVNAYTHCHDIRPWYITREQNPTAFWVKR
jgi:predicted O-methyltransferase YrrM